MKKRELNTLLILLWFICLNTILANDSNLVGTWKGKLDLPGQQLSIVFHISQDENNNFNAKMDSPDQGATGIPVSGVSFSDDEVSLTVSAIGGEYRGVLQENSRTINGSWKQSGYEFPLILNKQKEIVKKEVKKENDDSEVILETSTGKIYGTLELPDSKSPYTVALIISGSGPTDRDGNSNMGLKTNSYKMISETLASNGIASIRYDKRGIGKSNKAGLRENDLRFENYIDDAKDWIELLTQDSRFTEVIIIGHSEGSLIGMIASQQRNVSKFISLAGAGQSADKVIREQLKSKPPIVLEQANPILEKLVRGETVNDVPQMLNSLFRSSIQPYLISWFKYNPQKEIAKLKQPVLIIHGTTDIQVSIEEAERLVKANPKVEVKIINGMNHVLKDSEENYSENLATYSNPNLPLNKELCDLMIGFIQRDVNK
ncbi:MAG: alpha/beta fold hydrolase [Bacteroidota bacterium]